MNNKDLNLEQKPNSEQMPIDSTSAIACTKPNVGCCTSTETAMQEFIKTATKLRELNPLQDVMPTIDYQETLLSKERQQIIDAFTEGQLHTLDYILQQQNIVKFIRELTITPDNKEHGEQYFNNAFKK